MVTKPAVFISSTGDLRSARDLVAKVLYSMGCDPRWQDIEPTDGGDLLGVLRKWVDPCHVIIQLVGGRYGAEPPSELCPPEFGRVSFTQYEALYFEQTLERKVIYLLLDASFPTDPAATEPPDKVDLQAAYRRRIEQSIRLHHPNVPSAATLEVCILRMRDELSAIGRKADARYRRAFIMAAATLIAVAAVGAVVIVGLRVLHRGQAEQTVQIVQQTAATTQQSAKSDDLSRQLARVDEHLARIEEILAKQRQANPTAPTTLPAADLALLEQDRLHGDLKTRAAASVLQPDANTDALLAELQAKHDAEAFDLAMLQGKRWYYEKFPQYDKAIPPFERAMALRPDSFAARSYLASAHNFARLGDLTVHRRQAIAIGQETLERVALGSADWAMTQNNLGNAWSRITTGERGENLKKAIACYEAALTVRTRDAAPADWAMTQINLGSAWWSLPTDERGENLKKAIACYEAALTVYTRDAAPADWAGTQNNLGIAWFHMPTGEREENLKKAIACYEAALTVRTSDAAPADWAVTQNNLGNVWSVMPIGQRGKNLKKAIACYETALTVYTRDAAPADWAAMQNNLGNAWRNLPGGERGENLKKAIASYEAALTIQTRDAAPADWARTQNNLGTAWRGLPTGDRGENLKKAIACYEAALTVRTRDATPPDWATTQNNLGGAFADLAEQPGEDRCGRLRQAIACDKAALLVRTAEAFPREHLSTAKNLSINRRAYEAANCLRETPFEDIAPAK